MSIRIKRRWILAISCLIISGCTEKTIIREVPASGSPDASIPDSETPDSASPSTPGDGSNMVPGENDSESDVDIDEEPDQLEDPQTEDPQAAEEPDDNVSETPELTPADNEAVAGIPGENVDCENTLPCRWVSADEQFSVTVTNADNIGSRDRLQLNYSVSPAHDTEVAVTGGGQAVDSTDALFQPGEQKLGERVSGSMQTLLAGSSLNGSIVFDLGTQSSSLAEWSINILDGGVARLPSFSNIPVGTITDGHADCELVLPCVWVTPQGDVSITLTSAGGFVSSNRLSTTFAIQSATTMDVTLGAGAFAISSEGMRFDGRTHSLGAVSGYQQITVEAYAGYDLSGDIDYYQTNIVPKALDELSLVLYQDSPVPRWNPKFINIPVQ